MKKQQAPKRGPRVLVVDMGGQYVLRIATSARELGVRTAVLSPKKAADWLRTNKPLGIILSGGDRSVNDANSPTIPAEVFAAGVPILGLCYGMQALAKHFGGEVTSEESRKEYGPVQVDVDTSDPLFNDLNTNQVVLSSHGDTVTTLPPGVRQIATSLSTDSIAAFSNLEKRIWATQFHIEVDTTVRGMKMLSNFLFDICHCEQDWTPLVLADTIRQQLKKKFGTKRVVIGYSGGVDSSVSAALATTVFGDNLLGVVVDVDQFGEGEIEEIQKNAKAVNLNIVVVNAKARFQKVIQGVVSDKRIRKAFRKVYKAILQEEAKRFGATHLLQGTLAPDLIESGLTGGALIKTHHNTGLRTWLRQIHPLCEFFKYEVRALGQALGLPAEIYNRMPSPGPGLTIRVLGKSPTTERLAIVRRADAKVRKILVKHFLIGEIDQLGAHLICIKTTGIKGDERSASYPIVVRTINSTDFMTAKGYHIPESVKIEIEAELTRDPAINRVWFDTTPKPPATIELQ